ncbi:hypothetical protein [Solitalea lacus]|uniref:hypothetical protein n=1 Tax=Solitalea lacus TaxID=2911172 RepID=UPI001EDAB0C3|nr:hypothetical protein [Solitalea lacus]UKJ06492.1 hypothetical protein L2B55_13225 [Solitalea lacus]
MLKKNKFTLAFAIIIAFLSVSCNKESEMPDPPESAVFLEKAEALLLKNGFKKSKRVASKNVKKINSLTELNQYLSSRKDTTIRLTETQSTENISNMLDESEQSYGSPGVHYFTFPHLQAIGFASKLAVWVGTVNGIPNQVLTSVFAVDGVTYGSHTYTHAFANGDFSTNYTIFGATVETVYIGGVSYERLWDTRFFGNYQKTYVSLTKL